jgi:immune inhibitor A
LSGKEYYLAEYRRKIGYDAGLPGQGLLVWHIDDEYINAEIDDNLINANENRLGIELEQADGKYDLWNIENAGDSGDPFPGSSLNTNFNAIPYKLNYSNITPTSMNYIEIKNISLNGSTASAEFYISTAAPTTAPTLLSPANNSLINIQPTFIWSIVPNAKQYKLQIAEDNKFTTNVKEQVLSDYIIYKDNT